MINKIIIAFCEGSHDVAFVTRVLMTFDFKKYNEKIKNFAEPLNKQFEKELSEIKISDKKLGFQNPSYRLPSIALQKNNTLILIHNLGGDGRVAERNSLLELYQGLKGDDDFTKDLAYEIRFAYFFDADEVGVQERINQFKNEVGFTGDLNNGQYFERNGYEWGCYIFHSTTGESGTLEDLLLSYIDSNHPILKVNALSYLDQSTIPEDRCKEYVFHDGIESYKGPSKFYKKKSIFSVLGQLQFSGMSNAVIIKNTDLFKSENIMRCQHCRIIVGLFE